MPKAIAVWMYLDSLRKRQVLSEDPLSAKWTDGPMATYSAKGVAPWNKDLSVNVFASVARQRPNRKKPDRDKDSQAWKAFVAQDVELSPELHALLIDTSDFQRRPPSTGLERVKGLVGVVKDRLEDKVGLSPSCPDMPGECGELDEAQTVQLISWAKNISDLGGHYFVVGHHDWQSLTTIGKANLRRVFALKGFVTYVSGHTHQPTAKGAADSDEYWEVNVASVTDWPMEYARLSWASPGPGSSQVGVDTFADVQHAATGNACPLATMPSDLEALSERNYGSVDTYMMRAVDQYARLIAGLQGAANASERASFVDQCDDKCLSGLYAEARAAHGDSSSRRATLANLKLFDRNVFSRSKWVTDAEVSCAIWASEIEGGGGKTIEHGYRLPPGSHEFWVTHDGVPH